MRELGSITGSFWYKLVSQWGITQMKLTHYVFIYPCSWLVPLGAPATTKTNVMFVPKHRFH